MGKRGNLRYTGNGKKEEAKAWINAAMERNSEALGAEALSGSITDYTLDMNVRIVESDDCYRIILDPLSSESHDFNFKLDKKTYSITGMMVGSIEPDPE